MKLFVIIQLAVTVLGFLILVKGRDFYSAASFAIGSGLVLFNVISMALLWFHLIRKKLIALSLSIIVFKYPILGIIIYMLLSLTWVDRIWLCAGFASLVVTTLFFAAANAGNHPGTQDSEETNVD